MIAFDYLMGAVETLEIDKTTNNQTPILIANTIKK